VSRHSRLRILTARWGQHALPSLRTSGAATLLRCQRINVSTYQRFNLNPPIHQSINPAIPASPFPRFASPLARGFSLIEILITVGLLSFIILGLLLMFNQVQRAFRSSMTQTDVLESGRAVTDSLARELAEMTPCQISYTNINFPTLNFMAQLADEFTNERLKDDRIPKQDIL